MSASVKAMPRRKAHSASKQKLRLWLRLLRGTRAIEAALREKLRVEFRETMPRFDVLAALWKADDAISLTVLSRMLMVSNGNVTGIIDRLVLDGSVERISDSRDRRTTLVRLSDTGRARFETMAAAHEKWVADLLKAYDPQQTEALIDRLDIIVPRRDRPAQKSAAEHGA